MSTRSSSRFIQLNASDNVAVVLETIDPGVHLDGLDLQSGELIPAGHKIAVAAIESGQAITKYGQQIGVASQDISPGAHVHTHNVEVTDFDRVASPIDTNHAASTAEVPRTFDGIRRESGRAATRNYIGIVTSVNCSATVANYIAAGFDDLDACPNVDGVVPITHGHGCGQGADEPGMLQLQRTLAGFCEHPNFAAVLVVGLGCETNQIASMLESEGLAESERLSTMTIQGEGGTKATVERGREIVRELLPMANEIERVPILASELVLGLECGGSDGYSGISANPALGRAADLLVQQGGTAILSETPEIYGAEHLLRARAADAAVAAKLDELISWWEDYVETSGGKMDNNPTHGNKAGGLTTIYEKSLGAVAKGGTSPLVDVYRYAEPITRNGFVFMDSPGYDPMSITGQVASGANLVAFTTGRGSVYGCKPVPSLKIATNSEMFNRMRDDMDINCGRIVDGDATVEEMGLEIFDLLIDVASGQKTRSELLGFGDNEFRPWVFGAQM
ncbi:MAG: UxaA family hydrolase [Woeseiaceae bacterium]